ncbi:TerB N-terminal domain-containing protein [Paenibacillus sp. J22TS3]|uniref:TerB N-terminal domain-containing protein n=1 Tax=Paenibacillus sp. J22TS3 TaxID=2807192 RepID=UPI001B118686|nr:TerB N-terminal domain-containing protein [Paenibacillus sp. J22TS3]GIP23170.1 hypothetical protein J22TS3_34450 [Paenibacillus sp. J22TS3]
MKRNSDDLFFSEFDLDEEETGTSIPVNTFSNLGITRNVSIENETREQRFTNQAKVLADRIGDPAPFVPFMCYWPTYNDMTDPQQQWYFFWRSEVRNNRFPQTDLSYIFLHVYELINGVGWTEPISGLTQLIRLLTHYGGTFHQLQNYLFEWIFDFTLIHDLALEADHLTSLEREPERLPGEFLDMLLLSKFRESPLQISMDMLLTLSDYDMKRSRFFQGEGKVDLEYYIPRIMAVVDAYVTKMSSMRLIDLFSPETEQRTQRYLFRSAIYDSTLSGFTISVSRLPVRNHAPLRQYITQVLKFAENRLRKQLGFKGRLKGIELEPQVELLIDRYLSKEYNRKTTQSVIQIDTERLIQLQQDTEYVREMLTVEEEGAPAETYEEIHTHEDSVSGLIDQPDSSAMDHDNPEVPSAGWGWDTGTLGEEWSLLAEALEEVHLRALLTLMSDSPELTRLAEDYGTLPALIIDEINHAAMEHIGDLIVSEDGVVEDYLDYVKTLKG